MIKTVLPYLGSKSSCLGCILPHISCDTDTFIEPFCGSCAVTIGLLQSRPKQFKHMVCSDLNEDVILCWELIKRYGGSISDIVSDVVEEHLLEVAKSADSCSLSLPKVEDKTVRGALAYIKCTCTPSKRISVGVACHRILALRYGLSSLDRKRLDFCQELIQDVEFKHMDYASALGYANSLSDNVSVFCDPPYPVGFGKGDNYINDSVDMSEVLDNLRPFSNVVISYSDDDFVRENANALGYTSKVVDLSIYGISRRDELYLYK